MTAFLFAALGMLVAAVPLAVVVVRGTVMEAVVAYEAIGSIVVMVLVLIPQGLGRPAEFELPILLAALLLGSGLVFVHALERWLR